MANHYLKKAQKEYDNLVTGKIPAANVSGHIRDIRGFLNKAGTKDVAELSPGATAQIVEDRLAEEQRWADRVINVGLARESIIEARRTGKKHYTPPPDHVEEWARVLTIFPKAGIDTTPFTDGRPAPTITEMDEMVKQAEQKLEADAKVRAATIASWGKVRT